MMQCIGRNKVCRFLVSCTLLSTTMLILRNCNEYRLTRDYIKVCQLTWIKMYCSRCLTYSLFRAACTTRSSLSPPHFHFWCNHNWMARIFVLFCIGLDRHSTCASFYRMRLMYQIASWPLLAIFTGFPTYLFYPYQMSYSCMRSCLHLLWLTCSQVCKRVNLLDILSQQTFEQASSIKAPINSDPPARNVMCFWL